MKKITLIAAATVATLALAGCSGRNGDFAAMVEAREACHEEGGTFRSWANDLGYGWECDLSDKEVAP